MVSLGKSFGKIDGASHPDDMISRVARDKAIEDCAKIADARAAKLMAKAKTQKVKAHAHPYLHQAVEARVIAEAIRALVSSQKEPS